MFFVVLTVLGLTVGLRLYPTTASTSASGLSTPSSPGPSRWPQTTTATPTPGPDAITTSKTIAGKVEDTPYGPIQVSVTFTGTTISSVTELQVPDDRSRSVEINNEAAPILAQEVLSSQSARIDTVSGATYTSEGYASSVQSAIDQR